MLNCEEMAEKFKKDMEVEGVTITTIARAMDGWTPPKADDAEMAPLASLQVGASVMRLNNIED